MLVEFQHLLHSLDLCFFTNLGFETGSRMLLVHDCWIMKTQGLHKRVSPYGLGITHHIEFPCASCSQGQSHCPSHEQGR